MRAVSLSKELICDSFEIAKTGEENEYSVNTRVELRKLFPGKEVRTTNTSKLAANHSASFHNF